MNTTRILAGLLIGVVAALVVAVGVTGALATTVGFSVLVGLPAGIVAGVTVGTATYALLWARDRTTEEGPRRTGVVHAAVAALLALVAVIAAAALLFALADGTLGIVALWYGLPAAVVVAALAGYLLGTSAERNGRGPVPR
jgi:peptidoglycan/LPS O-acetylase OafA/YrhL